MDKPFPRVLISHAEDKFHLIEFEIQEHQAFTVLKFGEDITMIATDAEEHQ